MLSIVIPVFNEKNNVISLHQEIFAVMKKLNRQFEIIFVDDFSTDGTIEALKTLKPIKIISFRKNFGQTSALDAGIKEAKGDYIITLDGDGQNDPNDIPKLIEYLEKNNFDIVSGWRKNRQDTKGKRVTSLVAAFIRRYLINDGIHDSGCTLKIYKRECFEGVDLYGEMHRFIPAILKIKGFSIGEMIVNHRARLSGETKYNWTRGIKGLLDMISVWFWKKFANRPLHLFGTTGIIISLGSFFIFCISLFQKLFYMTDISGNPLFSISLFGIVMGIQFVVFGLMADILSKNYYASRKETVYSIKEIKENL